MNIFNRDKNIEKEIDNRLYKRHGYNGLHLYSISSYIDRLNELIVNNNQGDFALKEFENFLKYHSKLYFNYEEFPILTKEYMNDLYDFVCSLKKDFNIPYLNIYGNNVSIFISKFISIAVGCKFDVNEMLARYYPYAKLRSYGLIISQRNINYIYINNENDFHFDIKGKATCILYNPDFLDDTKFSELISLCYVNNVVSFKNLDDFDIYHKLNLSTNHRRTYFNILKELDYNYPGDNECINRIKNRVNDIINKISYFENEYRYESYKYNLKSFERDVQLIQVKNQNLIYELKELELPYINKLIVDASNLTENLGSIESKYNSYNKIGTYIYDSINTIKKNRFLYRTRTKGTIFGEENLSATLKTILEVKYQDHDVSVKQETINGSGFSDIEIEIGVVTVSIIECKLIKKNENGDKAISMGIEQLANRYSKPLHKYFDMPPKLYLLLFCVDPEWNNIRTKVSDILKAYCLRNNYEIDFKESPNTITLRASLIKYDGSFGNEILDLDIVICELEDQVDLDRINLKPYHKR